MLAVCESPVDPNTARPPNATGDIWSLYFVFYIVLWFHHINAYGDFTRSCVDGEWDKENCEQGRLKNLCRRYLDPLFVISPKRVFIRFQKIVT
jgi:hypothetical protein